jgi:hypothetical protein
MITSLIAHPVLLTLSLFPLFFLTMICCAYVCRTTHRIEIYDGVLFIDGSRKFSLDQISWYNSDSSFLMDGFRIKTFQGKNYYYSVFKFRNKEPNFQLFKDAILKRNVKDAIPEKTTSQLMTENKFLKYGSTVFLIVYIAVIAISLFTGHKIHYVKLIYTGVIIIGTFISTHRR